MWGPLKYQLKHVVLTTLQLHVMSRNVPQPFSQRVNIIHRLTFPDLQTVVIHYRFTHFIMEKLALPPLF